MFSGSIPALVTPFNDGKVDIGTFQTVIEQQITQGSSAVVPVGTTGESATLSHSEHDLIIETCVQTVAGRVPVIAGCGSNATSEAIRLTKYAELVGANAALIVTPYYNKPNQQGLYDHFKAIADASSLPIVIYNIPSRSVIDMSVETMARLSEISTVIGVKDATGNIVRVTEQRLACNADFAQLSGNDELALAFNAAGGCGCISVAANVAPALCAALQTACLNNDYKQARTLHDKLFPLFHALFLDSSPGPVKYAMWKLGIISSFETRLPITAPSQACRDSVDQALAGLDLLH